MIYLFFVFDIYGQPKILNISAILFHKKQFLWTPFRSHENLLFKKHTKIVITKKNKLKMLFCCSYFFRPNIPKSFFDKALEIKLKLILRRYI